MPLPLSSSSHQGSQPWPWVPLPFSLNALGLAFLPFAPSVPALVLPSMELCPPYPQVSLSTSHFALGSTMTTPGQSFWRQEGVVLGRKENIPIKSVLFFHLTTAATVPAFPSPVLTSQPPLTSHESQLA